MMNATAMAEPTSEPGRGVPVPVRVGIVDDSAFNRLCLSEWVEHESDLQLSSVLENGEEALRTWLLDPPDVAIVDLEMPKLDGLTLVRLLMAKRPFPVVVFSSYSSSDNVVRVLEAGALRFVAKPDSLVDVDATQLRVELLSAVREAARVDAGRLVAARTATPSLLPGGHKEYAVAQRLAVLVTGTGGPQALFELVSGVKEWPGLGCLALAAMPAKYMYSLAARLSAKTSLDVCVLEVGVPLLENTLYLVPRDVPFELQALSRGYAMTAVSAVADGASHFADVLLRSAAEVCGTHASAALLTGGGVDGIEGARAMQARGAAMYVQNTRDALVPDLVIAAGSLGLPAYALAELGAMLAGHEKV